MRRHLVLVSIIVLVIVAAFASIVAAYHLGYMGGFGFPDPAKQVELLAVYLAAATLAVTIAALAIGILGAVGYTAIKSAAVEAARIAGAEAGEKAIAPILARERLASGLSLAPQGGALDPLSSELAEGEQ